MDEELFTQLYESVKQMDETYNLVRPLTLRQLALSLKDHGPAIIAVNPGSMLGSKMVKQAFGVAGRDILIGAEIFCRTALADEFAAVSGQYFDNDSGQFASPHPDALDPRKSQEIVRVIETVLAEMMQ
jgi:hypothetical protein